MRWLIAAAALLALVSVSSATFDNCPAACSCKNKGGKWTVECVDRTLVTVPMGVDTETQVLDLSDNDMPILSNMMFSQAGLTNLQKVYLRNCGIERIDEMAFHGLVNLVELVLSENKLTSVPSHVFRDVPYLRNLSVAGNPIQKIEARAFADCPNVTHLDVSHCKLWSVAEKAFDGVGDLRSLRINDNYLTELSATVLESLNKLRSVELNDNPWVCDCRVLPMKRWYDNVWYTQPALCSGSSDQISGKPLAELDVEDLNCRPDVAIDLPSVTVSVNPFDSPHDTASSTNVMFVLVAFVMGLIALTAFFVMRIRRWSGYPPDAKPVEVNGSDGVSKTKLTLDLIHDHNVFLCDSPLSSVAIPPPSYFIPIDGTGSADETYSLGTVSDEVLSYNSQQHFPADYGLPIVPTGHHLNQTQYYNTPGIEV